MSVTVLEYRNGAVVLPIQGGINVVPWTEVARLRLSRSSPVLLDYKLDFIDAQGASVPQPLTQQIAGMWRVSVAQGDAMTALDYGAGFGASTTLAGPPRAVIGQEVIVQAAFPPFLPTGAVSVRAWVALTPVEDVTTGTWAGPVMAMQFAIGEGNKQLFMSWADRRIPPWARGLQLIPQAGNNQWYFRPEYNTFFGPAQHYWPGVRTFTTANVNDQPAPLPISGFQDLYVARVTTTAVEQALLVAVM